jgi:hypothetical protein
MALGGRSARPSASQKGIRKTQTVAHCRIWPCMRIKAAPRRIEAPLMKSLTQRPQRVRHLSTSSAPTFYLAALPWALHIQPHTWGGGGPLTVTRNERSACVGLNYTTSHPLYRVHLLSAKSEKWIIVKSQKYRHDDANEPINVISRAASIDGSEMKTTRPGSVLLDSPVPTTAQGSPYPGMLATARMRRG